MSRKTKIDWCDSTWNPVTGCMNGCDYCYAERIAKRFGGCVLHQMNEDGTDIVQVDGQTVLKNACAMKITEPLTRIDKKGNEVDAPYPNYFRPTFHAYRLKEPKKMKKPSKIFVVSMGDLFGDWVPNKWIQEVFDACKKAPWHKYLFLTKNPERFRDTPFFSTIGIDKNMWFGCSVTNQEQLNQLAMGIRYLPGNSFLSIEPLHDKIDLTRVMPHEVDVMLNFLNGGQYWLTGGDYKGQKINWVIIGAETGNRKNKIVPKKEWVQHIVDQCRAADVPVFMKDNLAAVWGEELIKEYPEGLKDSEVI